MAVVLIEEVLMGIEDAKTSLDEAVITLGMLTEDLHPALGHDLKSMLEQQFLFPLRSRAVALEQLLEAIASETEA